MQLSKIQLLSLTQLLERDEAVLAAYLFGSQAKGVAGPMSDVDLGIIFASELPIKQRELRLKQLFVQASKVLDSDNIDMFDLREVSVLLRYRAMFSGGLLFTKNRQQTNRLEFEAMQAYEDFKPHLEVQNHFIKHVFSV